MTIRIKITHDQPQADFAIAVGVVSNGGITETHELYPGQSGEFHVHSMQSLIINELDPAAEGLVHLGVVDLTPTPDADAPELYPAPPADPAPGTLTPGDVPAPVDAAEIAAAAQVIEGNIDTLLPGGGEVGGSGVIDANVDRPFENDPRTWADIDAEIKAANAGVSVQEEGNQAPEADAASTVDANTGE